MSRAASAQHGRPCPRCHAGPDDPCRTAGGRVTDTHSDRLGPRSSYRPGKLTAVDRVLIVELVRTGRHTRTRIAEAFGVSLTRVSQLVAESEDQLPVTSNPT